MKIEYAIENLGKTLKYDSQKRYLKEIVLFINKQHESVINENILFAKLFIAKLTDIKLHDFGSEVYPVNQKAMINILKLDLEEHYKQLMETLNTNYRREILEQNGINPKHEHLKTDKDLEFEELKIKNISKEDIKKIKSGLYELDEVKDRVNKMLSKALIKY